MNQQRQKGIPRPPIMRLILVQGAILLTVSAACLFIDRVAAYSALLGGLIFFLPNIYFAHKTFAHSGARAARQIVSAFYKGEAVKLLLAAVLFALVFKYVRPIDEAALFITFAVMLMSNWLAPVMLGTPSRR
ncbi:F0F1 ATP synthase subunit I [Marinobacteraceae bacterium S3BR75-40.1]